MSKSILKNVREAIKAEKYAEAIAMSEALLKDEPKNYMAYLLLGAAYQSSNKIEAANNLRKAIEYSPAAPTVALQGLSNCAPLVELPKIYEQLLELVPQKFSEYFDKLYVISSNSIVTQSCLDIFKKQAKAEDYTRRQLAMKYLARMCVAQNLPVSDEEEQLFEASLKIAYEDEHLDVHLLCCKRYLKLLYKQKQYKQCLFNAVHITELYSSDVYAFEWICKIYCENYENTAAADWWSVLKNPIHFYAQELLRLNENSGLALLIKAIDAFKQQQFIVARDLLQRIQVIQPNYGVALKLLARTEMELGAYELALELYQQLGSEADQEMRNYCMRHIDDKELTNELLDEANLLRSSAKNVETFDELMLLGRLQLQEAKYAEALISMLKATRLRPHRSQCFYYLGKIYYSTQDMERARKCFEKCVNLNPRCEDAINTLSAIYQQLGEKDLNIALLLSTLKHIKNENQSKRLLYKLGLHYLSVNKWDDAIQSFRNAIKLDVTCINYWESLGDAYCERGSYNSAIRVFQKILELDAENIYAKLQIAVIKMTIRMYPEAIEDFNNLLAQHPDYLPGLKGAAEAHIGLAHNLKLEHRYVRCKTHLQLASNHLQRAFHSLQNNDIVWLWRLHANVFVQTALLPTSMANLSVMRENELVLLHRKQLLQMATRFYTCALKIQQNTFLWYELALCAYNSAQHLPAEANVHLELALKACRLSIQKQQDRWQNWNLLGVINMHKAINNLPLAQHCFIQALQIDRKSYTSWTNLGVLYLVLGDIKLSNQAFQRAQQSSPIYPNAWIGQAMIAETISEDEEALDLFRHCQQFELHVESAIGYAHWVCNILVDNVKRQHPHYKHSIENMHADVVALDAINWYAATTEENASVAGLTFQGFLNERQKLYRTAVTAYRKAASKAATAEECDKLITNQGYLYLKLNQPLDAINAFNAVSKANFKPMIGLALAYFRAGQHQEAYAVYQSVLQSVAGNEDNKAGMILVAMAAMVYASQGEADTKTILYQCILLKDSPIQALYSACALGILHNDTQLTETILTELKKYENKQEYCAHIAYLRAQHCVANKQPRSGLLYLISRVHIFPSCVELRKVLANFLLDNFAHKRQYQLSTSQIALSAIVMGHRNRNKQHNNSCMEDSESLMIASRALQPVNEKHSHKLMQRAIHLYPQNKNAWNALLQAQ